MNTKTLNPVLGAVLEFGPTLSFVVVYLLFRNQSVLIGGTQYSGLVAVTAAFVPIFILATGILWWLTGRIARLQVAMAVMVLVFGLLGLWFNDPRLLKMKPTVIYLALALVLCIGLWRGESWLKYILEDTIPLKRKGWMLLTKRITVFFFLAAGANELVWRTQSEELWVLFETVGMPVVVVAFFVAQIPLFVEYFTLKQKGKKG